MTSKVTHTQSASPIGDDRIAVYETLVQARAEFGENYGAQVFRLTRAQVEALLAGNVVAFDIYGSEYAGFLILADENLPAKE